ncbi:Serine/threonine-protein kinase CTR1 [Auxenochlorella protothecoides]|uniref:Serine/threonine-protein kinase CTR1 n=1 Tax=Auxenochlorella protothecoides TaxID=3075 RepID=A0A087SM60_AUXPR|nr:Serine/threonine-protein kinase CTR1 [Auxenochlorella protothecoides]KFM26814.1 Serine/threonine-protein kinase CTR1 [Auxenochlorella protothecoides]
MVGSLTASLAALTGLQSLLLGGNSLTGSVPSAWNTGAALGSLTVINLTANAISALPTNFGAGGCSNLVTLALDSNGMTGSLPGSLTLTALKAATFVGNALTGSIPTWSKGLPSSASVAVLPQTGTTSLCGSVPASPGLTYSSSGTSFALANSLGSCFVPCSQTVTTSLTGTNLFDVAVAANVTAWDLARGNLLTPGQGTASSVTIPCYGTGSPVGSYLGGDAAYGALAWGSASGAASVTSHSTSSCLAASGTGSYVRVDLAASYALASVVLVLAGNGLAGGAVSVGVAADGSDATTCASGLVLGAGTVAVTCAASGRYVTVSGTTLGLCGVQVYPAVSDAALGKAATYTTASGTATLASFSTAAKLGIAGSSPSFVLDLGYTASLASVVVGSPTGLGVVSLQASNPLAGTSPSSRRLLRAAPSGVDAAGVAGAGGEAGMEQLGAETRATTTASAVGRRLLASTACSAGSGAGAWTCAGLSGRYLVLAASDGTLSFTTLRAFASAAPALAVPPPPPPPGGGATLTSQLIFVGGTVATFRLTSTSDRTVFLAAINAAFQAAIEDAGYEMTTADTTLESATTSINPSEYGYTGSVPSGAQTLLLTVSYTTTLPATSVDSVLGTSSVASAISSSLDASGFGAPAKQVGEGSFGRVYLAKWHETLVAVKVLMATGVDIDDVDEAARALTMSNPIMASLHKARRGGGEAHMMASMRHPNVVGFLGLCTNPPCVASEYCARGSLTDVLRGAARSPARAAQLDWSRRLNMALDACKGMLYLHSHAPPIVHRDLKSPNLLVDRHWRVKISDFNLSKLLDGSPVMSSLAATNPRWLAPEILAGHAATFASDVYAFGIVLWEMLTWELPWPTSNPWQVVTVVTEGGRLAVPDRAALPGPDTQDWDGLDAYVDLIRACWAQNPNDRPTFSEVIPVLRDLLEALMHKNATQGRPSSTPVGPPTMAEPLYLKQAASLSRLGATRSNGGGAGDSVPGDPPAPGSTA